MALKVAAGWELKSGKDVAAKLVLVAVTAAKASTDQGLDEAMK